VLNRAAIKSARVSAEADPLQLDTGSFQTYQAGLYWNAGGRPIRRGNQHPCIVPYEVFRARDAYLTLGVANSSLWEKTCRALGREDLARDPRFESETSRVTNRDALIPILNDLLAARPADEWLARLEQAGVPAGRIRTVAEVCESPHLKARGMVVKLRHPKAGAITVGVPVRLGATPGAATAPPPLLGRHTERSSRASLAYPECEGGEAARGGRGLIEPTGKITAARPLSRPARTAPFAR